MSKKPAKAEAAKPDAAKADAAGAEAAPKKRSKLKLALIAVVGLALLGGGGYGGWIYFGPGAGKGADHGEAHAAAEGEHGAEGKDGEHGAEGGEHGEAGDHGRDAMKVAAIARDSAAETSFTYSFALAELVRRECGSVKIEALKAASEKEAAADGILVNLSWQAANRRTLSITAKSCNRILVEIDNAEARASGASKPAEEKPAGGH